MMNEEEIIEYNTAGFTGTGGTVKVGSRTYAVGLVWETITSGKKKSPSVIAKESGKEQYADFFCLRPPANMQYGLGAKSVGHKAKMAPLASVLAENIDGSFVAVFEVDDSYYVCAVRDEVILAGYDRLFEDKQAAADFFTEIKFNSSWDSSFAPEDWNIQDTVHKKLDEILGGDRPSSKILLQPISSRGMLIKGCLIFLLLLAGVSGYLYNQQLAQDKIASDAADAAARKIDLERKSHTKVVAVHIPPMPWEGQASMVQVLNACMIAISSAPLDIPGWKPVAITCHKPENDPINGPLLAIMTIHRDGGTLNWIAPFINKPNFKPQIRPTQQSAQGASSYDVIWNVDLPADAVKYVANSSFTEMVKTRYYLTSQFEELFQVLTIKETEAHPIDYVIPPPSNSRASPQRKAFVPYRNLAFGFQTAQDPMEYIATLKPIPLSVLGKLTLDLSNWQWTIEGNVYEKLPIPNDFPKETPNAQK